MILASGSLASRALMNSYDWHWAKWLIYNTKKELTATEVTCAVRASTGEFTGGRASPWVELLPPFELRWTLMVNKLCPFLVSQWAISGLRVEFQAGLRGSMRPGLKLFLCWQRRIEALGRAIPEIRLQEPRNFCRVEGTSSRCITDELQLLRIVSATTVRLISRNRRSLTRKRSGCFLRVVLHLDHQQG